jgi:MYXO-CTERM domain-containing protein
MRTLSTLTLLALIGCGGPAASPDAGGPAAAPTPRADPAAQSGAGLPLAGTAARALPGRVELEPAGLTLSLRAPGRAAAATVDAEPRAGACTPSVLGACAPRLEYPLPNGAAWFRARGAAIQQGWTVNVAPTGDGPLRLTTDLPDAELHVAASGRTARVVHAGRAWQVGALAAVDADGRSLPARFVASPGGLTVEVDDATARYPVTVDPLYEVASVTLTSGVDASRFGYDVDGLGDINGDGAPDFAIGAPDEPEGAVYLYLGTGSLPSAGDALRVTSPPSIHFGSTIAGLGDINSDGLADWAAADTAADVVHVFLGGVPPSTTPSQSLYGTSLGDYGSTVLGLGDIDGDGFGDVAIGDPTDSTLAPSGGRVDLFRGGAAGLELTPFYSALGDVSSADFGGSLAVGDVIGDEWPDLIIGAPSFDGVAIEGAIHIYAGGPLGFTGSAATQVILGDPATQGNLGAAVVIPGDLNGDGKDDLVATAGLCLPFLGSGCVVNFHGGEAGLTQVDVQRLGLEDDAALGTTAATVGDVNGDGVVDTLIGAPFALDGYGIVYLYETPSFAAIPGLTLGAAGDGAAWSAAGAGDVDADGFGDVLISAPDAADGAGIPGVVWLHRGSAGGLGVIDEDEDGVELADDCDDADPTIGLPLTWYVDGDGDGFGDGTSAVEACTQPPGYAAAAGDCDDAHATAYPGASEVCDADDVDEDCNELVDDADPGVLPTSKPLWYVDDDGDGWGVLSTPIVACDVEERATAIGDCDDTNPAISPDATEVCDALNVDENCNGSTEDDDPTLDLTTRTAWSHDLDGDSYGDASDQLTQCDRPAGYRADSTDCDDTRASVNPGATEVCDPDNRDEDCDGAADNDDDSASAASKQVFYADADGDLYGVTAATLAACDLPEGYAIVGNDCDDTRDFVNPAAAEVCDSENLDEDCDARRDDEDASVDTSTFLTWFVDVDRDGYGDPAYPWFSCDVILLHVGNDGDCDDTRADVSPDAPEVCDAADVDEDCDGVADDQDDSTTGAGSTPAWIDADGDSFGDAAVSVQVCDGRDGYVFNPNDCDDTRADVSPLGAEVCDADDVDEDCDSAADDADPSADPTTFTTWFADADGDLWGDEAQTATTCDLPAGYLATAGDCDDDRADVRPDGVEICDAGRADEDCDGLADDNDDDVDSATQRTWYRDADRDDHGDPADSVVACRAPVGFVASSDDCDDTRADVNPGAREQCDPADRDEDCDGLSDDADSSVATGGFRSWYVDADGDSYGISLGATSACDVPDGYASVPGDCDDAEATTYPGGTEIPGDGADSDCDGRERCFTDSDDDGHGAAPVVSSTDLTCGGPGLSPLGNDCNDTDASRSPSAPEVCDLADVDEDCDGLSDDADASVDPATRLTLYADADRDGYGDPDTTRPGCDPATGWVLNDDDCNDGSALANPAITIEVPADQLDNNCDGLEQCYVDADGDHYGTASLTLTADLTCTSAGVSLVTTDCDDAAASINPAATEVCDPADVDENCNGRADDDDSSVDTTSFGQMFPDFDGDGFGVQSTSRPACDPLAGEAANQDDCDDSRADISPAGTEVCDPMDADEDCDGLIDDLDDDVDPASAAVLYTDADGDGYGVDGATSTGCDASPGLSVTNDDCDDGSAAVSPGATEVCDPANLDEDCDGLADDADPSTDPDSADQTFTDADSDGYGDPSTGVLACDPAAGRVADDQDCDDNDDAVSPDATADCSGGADADCNGVPDIDDPLCAADDDDKGGGCSCDTKAGPSAPLWLAAVGALAALRRRRVAAR